MMKQLITAILLEQIKARNTKSFWLVLLFGLACPLIFLFEQIYHLNRFQEISNIPSNYLTNIYDTTYLFVLVFMSIATIIYSAQGASIEHKNQTWTLIETQPIGKGYIYLAKYLRVLKLMILTILLYILFFIIIVSALYYVFDLEAKNYYLKFEWKSIVQHILNSFFCCLSLAATMYALHINISRTNLITTLSFLIFVGYLSTKYLIKMPVWIPFVQMDLAGGKLSEVGEWITYYSRLSFTMSLFILAIGFLFYKYKHYHKNVFSTAKSAWITIGIWIIGSAICYWLQIPRIQRSYGKSIIAGHIDADIKIDSISVMDEDFLTLVTIPVSTDGNFHISLDSISIPTSKYIFGIRSANQLILNKYGQRQYFFLSNGDSVYAEIQMKGNESSIALSGDRAAERNVELFQAYSGMEYLGKKFISKEASPNDKDAFLNSLEINYTENLIETNKLVTVDGFIPAPDVAARSHSLLALDVIDLWYKFCNYHKIDPHNSWIESLEKEINMKDVSLAKSFKFRDYLYQKLSDQNGVVKDMDKWDLVTTIEDKELQESMRFNALRDVLINNAIEDSLAIAFVSDRIHLLKAPRYTEELNRQLEVRKAMTKFEIIPEFTFADQNDARQTLQQFEGDFVVIDVWASWCQPCKADAPYYRDYAEKYHGKGIQFVSISCDTDTNIWKSGLKENKNLSQWISSFNSEFVSYFAIQSIPRYILLDPTGKVINHNLPSPSTKNFEEMLNQYISK